MTLSQALELIQKRQGAGRKRQIGLVCGFEPLHLGTFLKARVIRHFESDGCELRTGLYGNPEETLAALCGSEAEGAALVLEWSTLDSRLGLRSTGGWGPSAQQDILDSCREHLARLRVRLEALAGKMPVVVVGPTLPLLLFGHTPGGRMSRQELELEKELAGFLAGVGGFDRVSVVNSKRLDSLSPVNGRSNHRMELNAGFPYSLEHASLLAGQIVEALFPRAPMKGLISDLDDTLWSGILGEVGVKGVSWSLAEHSQIHGLYQQLLKQFSETGVLLAIASKNELTAVQEGLLRDDLLVPRSAFYPVRADWGAKSRHIEEILRVWNVGADSVVFVDDSPMELDEVRTAFPSMTCLEFPAKKPAAAVALFGQLRDLFGKASVNQEDSLRKASIEAGEAFRESAKSAAPGDFVRSLNGQVVFDDRKDPANQRVLELINKTNQFNLNGARISEGEWLRHLADPASFAVIVAYEDKFGPLGTIGVVAGTMLGECLEISAWVLSCRAFSRRIEFHTLRHLFDLSGAKKISLAFAATPRNQPLQEFVQSLGLKTDGPDSLLVLSKEQFEGGNHDLPHRVVATSTS